MKWAHWQADWRYFTPYEIRSLLPSVEQSPRPSPLGRRPAGEYTPTRLSFRACEAEDFTRVAVAPVAPGRGVCTTAWSPGTGTGGQAGHAGGRLTAVRFPRRRTSVPSGPRLGVGPAGVPRSAMTGSVPPCARGRSGGKRTAGRRRTETLSRPISCARSPSGRTSDEGGTRANSGRRQPLPGVPSAARRQPYENGKRAPSSIRRAGLRSPVGRHRWSGQDPCTDVHGSSFGAVPTTPTCGMPTCRVPGHRATPDPDRVADPAGLPSAGCGPRGRLEARPRPGGRAGGPPQRPRRTVRGRGRGWPAGRRHRPAGGAYVRGRAAR